MNFQCACFKTVQNDKVNLHYWHSEMENLPFGEHFNDDYILNVKPLECQIFTSFIT